MVSLTVQPLTAAQIRQFLTWEYEGPYAMYDMTGDDVETAVLFFSNPDNGYFAIVNEGGELLGFCNFGADARVPGGAYDEPALDIGIGMRPDLTGRKQGAAYAAAVFAFAAQQYPAPLLRVTIAEFNERAQRLCRGFGFEITGRFERGADGRPFVIMTRAVKHDEG
jgi:RimJ/RimL family protein N-acetyltransferase